MAEKLNPFYKMSKTEVPITTESELKETFDSVNKTLSDACELALKQPIAGKQLVLLKDASFRYDGYSLLIEVNPDQNILSEWKTYAPGVVCIENFLPRATQDVLLLKRYLSIYMAILEFAHILWETMRPTNVLTDNKCVTSFSQTKALPPALRIACHYMLQFNFKRTHIAG